jgi:hypothetical protein
VVDARGASAGGAPTDEELEAMLGLTDAGTDEETSDDVG